MNDFLKKLGLAGLGLISFTEKELAEIFDKLVKEGKVNEPEAKKIILEIKTTGNQYWNKYGKDYENKAETLYKNVAKKVEISAKKEIAILKKKLAKFEKGRKKKK